MIAHSCQQTKPFTLLHGCIWVAACAVAMAFHRQMLVDTQPTASVLVLSYLPLFLRDATYLCFALVIAARLLRLAPLFAEPGEYLWAASTFMWLGVLVSSHVLQTQLAQSGNARDTVSWVHFSVTCAHVLGVIVLFTGSCFVGSPWRRGLRIVAALEVVAIIGTTLLQMQSVRTANYALQRFDVLLVPLSSLAVGYLLFQDRHYWASRSWSHWVGVVLWLAVAGDYTLNRVLHFFA